MNRIEPVPIPRGSGSLGKSHYLFWPQPCLPHRTGVTSNMITRGKSPKKTANHLSNVCFSCSLLEQLSKLAKDIDTDVETQDRLSALLYESCK